MLYSSCCIPVSGGNTMPNNKHLDLTDRSTIETELNMGSNFKHIAMILDKDPSTISKEVRLHSITKNIGSMHRRYNACVNRYDCEKQGICFQCKAVRKFKYCRSCGLCNAFCKDFVAYECPTLRKAPYVCNGCHHRTGCTLSKCFYHARPANEAYVSLRSESRIGISLSEDELRHVNDVVSKLILQGQSIHHICSNNRDTLMISERTLYRLIDSDLISAKNIDLPRKVRYRKRKKKTPLKVDRKCRIGRTFDLFLQFMDMHPDIPVTQIDSVEGKKGGKVLLTIHFVKAEFMLAFLRDYNDSRSVTRIFNDIDAAVGRKHFMNLFQVILTDNGSEFSDPVSIEVDQDGVIRTRLFYCDPQAPWQKGSAERNHEFIRQFIPKGISFDDFSQSDISLMMDHINSYKRESLNDRSPFEMFRFLYGSEVLDLLGCHPIPPQNVTLNRSIFKKRGDSK